MTQRENTNVDRTNVPDGVMKLTPEERLLVQALKDPVYKERLREVLFPSSGGDHLS